jgi:hypothetical protein
MRSAIPTTPGSPGSTAAAREASPLRHPRPGDAPWVHPRGRWDLARHRVLVLDGHRQRTLARLWGAAWSRRHPVGLEGWLLLIPDRGSPHQCRVEELHPARAGRPGAGAAVGTSADDLTAAARVPDGPVQRSFVVLRLGQDQLRFGRIGFSHLQQDTATIEAMILRLQAAVCPGLPVVVEGLFDEASQEWFADLARRHSDWWLSWRPAVRTGHVPRVIQDSPPRDATPD